MANDPGNAPDPSRSNANAGEATTPPPTVEAGESTDVVNSGKSEDSYPSKAWPHVAVVLLVFVFVFLAASGCDPSLIDWSKLGEIFGTLDAFLLGLAALSSVVWNIRFMRGGNLADRDPDKLLENIHEVRTTMSWFVGLYGTSIAFALFRGEVGSSFEAFRDSGIQPEWFALPLVAAICGIFFVPIRKSIGDQPTPALRSMFFLAVTLQQIAFIGLLFLVLKIAMNLSELIEAMKHWNH